MRNQLELGRTISQPFLLFLERDMGHCLKGLGTNCGCYHHRNIVNLSWAFVLRCHSSWKPVRRFIFSLMIAGQPCKLYPHSRLHKFMTLEFENKKVTGMRTQSISSLKIKENHNWPLPWLNNNSAFILDSPLHFVQTRSGAHAAS
jgi:hypothetical protein